MTMNLRPAALRTALCALACALILPAAAQRRRTTTPATFPPCAVVNGTPAVTYTRDEGRTLAPVAQALSGIGYTYGLAVLDTPGVMLSWHKNTLSISRDYGCSWTPLGDWATEFPPTITPARGGRAYAWSDNRQFLLRYDARGAQVLKPPAVFVGLGTDGDRVRAGDDRGGLWESDDAGDSWTQIAHLPSEARSIVYRFSFDPSNLDHIIAGTAVSGAFVTFDGGRHWARSSLADNFNVMNFAMSPADPNVVWAMAIDTRSDVKAIHESSDGGRTFNEIVRASADVTIINQPVMAAHPTNRDVLYFVFGTHFQNYGTDLFRVDAQGNVTVAHNANDDINSIVFSPYDPSLMYLGLETEKGVF